MSAIVADHVAKTYRGGVQALRGVSLAIEPGEIFGLLGPNGAGKTTLVKILLDLVRPTTGATSLLGLSSRRTVARREVGYLPEDHRFPDYHTATSALVFYASLSGIAPSEARRRAARLLDEVGLGGDLKRKIRGFSKGMKQRLGLAQALISEPMLLFLDEPTDGVDPVGRAHIRGLLDAQKRAGRTIFLNSHLLSEVEQFCDRVAILRSGELVREGTVAALTQAQSSVTVTLSQPPGEPLVAELAAAFGNVRAAGGATVECELERDEQIDGVIDFLRARGIGIRGLENRRQSLEEVFLESVLEPAPGASEAPADEAPADEAPADEAPADEAPADETTSPAADAGEAAADAPADTPADTPPAEEGSR